MFWSEEQAVEDFQVPKNVIDVSFKVSCKQIKPDHAWSLTQAIAQLLPWFLEQPQAAVHHIYIPQSGNGWERADDFFQLSRRTRLKIRIPAQRLTDLQELTGKSIFIDGSRLTFGASEVYPLSALTTLVARHVHVPDTDHDETLFLQQLQRAINALGIQVRKMLCGKSHQLSCDQGKIITRSLMIADISPAESVRLQEHGIGSFYHYGCGVFIPQKGISAVNQAD